MSKRLYEVHVTSVLVVATSDKEACDIVRQAGVEVSVEDPDGYWSHWVGGAERPLAWAEMPDPPVTT